MTRNYTDCASRWAIDPDAAATMGMDVLRRHLAAPISSRRAPIGAAAVFLLSNAIVPVDGGWLPR